MPRQDSVNIDIELSNDSDRALNLDQDFNFKGNELFLVTITNENGQRVFELRKELQGVRGWEVGEVKKFSLAWPVSANMVGDYLIAVRVWIRGTTDCGDAA